MKYNIENIPRDFVVQITGWLSMLLMESVIFL